MFGAVDYVCRVWYTEKYFQHVIVDYVGTHRGKAGYRQSLSECRDMASYQACNNQGQEHCRLRRQNDIGSEAFSHMAQTTTDVPEEQRGGDIQTHE